MLMSEAFSGMTQLKEYLGPQWEINPACETSGRWIVVATVRRGTDVELRMDRLDIQDRKMVFHDQSVLHLYVQSPPNELQSSYKEEPREQPEPQRLPIGRKSRTRRTGG